jgi:hypothetical protein
VANLVRHIQSGNYYARIRVRGKLIWKWFKTDRISVAKLRLGDFHKEQRQLAAAHTAVARGKMTFGSALGTFRQRLLHDYALKERSRTYRQERIAALLKSWPNLETTDVSQISKTDCLTRAAWFSQKGSPSAFTNTIGTLRLVLDIAVGRCSPQVRKPFLVSVNDAAAYRQFCRLFKLPKLDNLIECLFPCPLTSRSTSSWIWPWTELYGSPNDATVFPGEMQVDYDRVYDETREL